MAKKSRPALSIGGGAMDDESEAPVAAEVESVASPAMAEIPVTMPEAAPENVASVAMLKVHSPSAKGFRRFGRLFTRTPQEIPLAELSEEQVKELLGFNKHLLVAEIVGK